MTPPALTKWLVATGTAVVLSLSTWAGASIIKHGQQLAAQDAKYDAIDQRLGRIEELLIRAVRDR